MLLSIDTSTRFAGVALSEDRNVIASLSWYSRQNHTAELAPAITRILEQSHIQLQEVEAISIALGPGGFSALKVGMSMAKGIAIGKNVPLVGVNTLDMEAYPYHDIGLTVCPILSMGRGEYAWALYSQAGGKWQQTKGPGLMKPEVLVRTLPNGTLYCGEAAEELKDVLKEVSGGSAKVQGFFTSSLRLKALAFMGCERLHNGDHDDLTTLQPFYMRRPSISAMKPPKKVQR